MSERTAMSDATEPTRLSKAMLKGLYDWMREPDFAEEFTLADAMAWIDRRPIAIAAMLVGETSAAAPPSAEASAPGEPG